jgi:dTDP-glucose pyrophosphorylase
VEEILLVVGYRRELVEAHFERFPGIRFAVQEVVEGTASAVRLGRTFAAREPFILTFGDIICDATNYSGISETFERERSAAVIGVKHVPDPWQGAAVYADHSGRVSKMIEKPKPGTSTTNWNSAGLYAFAPVVFEEIDRVPRSPRGEYEITSAVEQLIGAGQPVHLFAMHGDWRDVGRPEDLKLAADLL